MGNLLDNPCPVCGAKAGKGCRTKRGRGCKPHEARYQAAGRRKHVRAEGGVRRRVVQVIR